MQDELAVRPADLNAATGDTPAEATARRPRRSLRALWKSVDEDRRGGIVAVVLTVTIVGTLYGSAFTALAIWNHNGRTQAVQRAKKMDGEVYNIVGVSSNFVGDTRLFLQNARGEDCGWVMIYMSNPLTEDVNPIFLLFNRKRTRYPMKVRAHYREQPHALKDGKTVERFTGSFLDFEKLDK